MICPETPLATASGLMMVRVRWTAIAEVALPFLAHHTRHGGAHVGGALDGGDAGGLHGGPLLRGGAPCPRDDRPRVAPPAARRGGLAADETHPRAGGGGLESRGAPLPRAAARPPHS